MQIHIFNVQMLVLFDSKLYEKYIHKYLKWFDTKWLNLELSSIINDHQ